MFDFNIPNNNKPIAHHNPYNIVPACLFPILYSLIISISTFACNTIYLNYQIKLK